MQSAEGIALNPFCSKPERRTRFSQRGWVQTRFGARSQISSRPPPVRHTPEITRSEGKDQALQLPKRDRAPFTLSFKSWKFKD